MKKAILAILIVFSLSSTVNASTENEASTSPGWIFTGIIFGCTVAGPAGAYIGSVVGAFVGDQIRDDKNTEQEETTYTVINHFNNEGF